MEAIFQFVDEVVEAQRDTYCAIADDIWDHPETRFEEFWSAQRLADARRRKVFSSPAMLAGSRMPLSPASVRANRSLPCSANLTPGGTQPAGPQRGTDALDAGSQRPRLWAQSARHRGIRARSPPKAGCNSTATAALCASTVVPARKAVREKPLWCAKGCLMMSMRR